MMSLLHLVASKLRARRNASSRHGMTLVQVVVVIALLAVFSSLGIPSYTRARARANSHRCDAQLKGIALALDAYRQTHKHLPTTLDALVTEDYLKDVSQLRCPNDPREHPSYEDFYVLRARDEGADIPVLMCPFHESVGMGNQARIGLYTTQFATRPARLEAGNAITVETPGQKPRRGYAGMELHGGDRISTQRGGMATIAFADGSRAELSANSDVTVLQSFIDGQRSAPLYTVLRQSSGEGIYTVHHGSRFDVTTPTATAGARGTKFRITIDREPAEIQRTGGTRLWVEEGKVVFTGGKKTVVAPVGREVTVNDAGGLLGDLIGGLLGGVFN